jgi:hypothetical protein
MTPAAPPVVAARLAATLLLALPALELAGRSVARASMLEAVAGRVPGTTLLVLVAAAGALLALAVERSRGRLDAHALVACALLFALTPGLAWQLRLGARLQSDGFYYFAHLRSLWFDGDQDLANDYRLLGMASKAHLFVPTPTGHAQSAWTIGPSLAWGPFFAVGDVVAHRLAASGREVAVDGTSFPYRQAVCVAGLVWGLVGLYASFRLGRLVVPPAWAAFGVTLVGGGSFLLWYLVKEPSMTHAPSMASVALFAWAWYSTAGRRRTWQWAALGLVAGIAGTIRWQNVLFALLPACEWIATAVRAARAGERQPLARHVGDGLAFTLGGVIGFVPQMLAWKAIYGSYVAVSPIGPQIRWWAPHVGDILWSSRNGLFSTGPVVYAGAAGLLLLAWRAPAFGVPALVACAAMTYFNASIQDWWGSASFGMRRFDGILPLVAVGVGAIGQAASRAVAARPQVAVGVAGLSLAAWNLTFMDAALSGVVKLEEPVPFEALAGRQASTLERWLGHPFSYPANLVFAIANGRSPSEYDTMWVSRFLGDPAQPYGRVDLGGADATWLGEGWYDPEKDGTSSFRWAGARATLAIALDHAAPLRVTVRARPYSYPGAPPQALSLVVNGRSYGPVPAVDGWNVVTLDVPAEAWRTGVNDVVLVFSRATRPADVGASGDGRTLAAAVDWLRVAVIDAGEAR